MEHIPDRIDSRFRFVLLAAARAEQMMRGAQPKVATPQGKPTRVAIQEIVSELVDWDYGPAPQIAPEGEVAPAAAGAEEA
ncbi:MAG: DNA-directed RNA polymerase subunit omega [Thermoanaerobaculia bacterium]